MGRMTMKDERIEPIWSLLDAESFSALMATRGRLPAAVRIERCSSVAPAAAPLLGVAEAILAQAREQDGLRLTASGFLGLNEVKAIFESIPWEERDKAIIRSVCRVIHEQDFTPLHLTRLILQKARLLRRQKDRLFVSKARGDAFSSYSEIVASVFWGIDLAEFDGVPFSNWPQDHVGVTLWAISACCLQWTEQRDLMALTTLSHPALERTYGDGMLAAFQLRILRPLVWLGLMELEQPWDFSARSAPRVRKFPAFDRVFRFTVKMLDQDAGSLH
jgi:hypothetical protein